MSHVPWAFLIVNTSAHTAHTYAGVGDSGGDMVWEGCLLSWAASALIHKGGALFHCAVFNSELLNNRVFDITAQRQAIIICPVILVKQGEQPRVAIIHIHIHTYMHMI